MTISATQPLPLLAPADRERIDEAIAFIRSNDTASVLAALVPSLPKEDRNVVAGHSRFSHAAVLVFPTSAADIRPAIQALGLAAGEITPSVVVRDRLIRRYAQLSRPLEVGIVRAPVTEDEGQRREIEIFTLAAAPRTGLEEVAKRERLASHESHVALEVHAPDEVVLSGLRGLLIGPGCLEPDGGGYNASEDSTVLYFRNANRDNHLHRRLELIATGHYPRTLQEHCGRSSVAKISPPHDGLVNAHVPARELLGLMTGAWTTQAIAVAAELRIADHIANGAVTYPRLATLTGADPDSLGRLLRYLASLGVVSRDHETFGLTSLGDLLRVNTEHSLHSLALLYGGPFYVSFGNLAHSVRTGGDAFESLFGAHHFDYFADRPELSDLFNRGMAASSSMFIPVLDLVDFTAARVVVDIGGGHGELLRRVVRAAPHVRGVLFERANVIDAAREALVQTGDIGRVDLMPGDFTRDIPGGGDIYILSRVLHDWDDETCRLILRRCAQAMPQHADLLIVERLLPEDDSPSLAVAWDVHMLCNVGGRERTIGQFRKLLADAGLELTGQHPLPLDANLLRARLAVPSASPERAEQGGRSLGAIRPSSAA